MFKALLVAILAFVAGLASVQAAGDDTVTHKVFFDVEIDGKPAGATVAALNIKAATLMLTCNCVTCPPCCRTVNARIRLQPCT